MDTRILGLSATPIKGGSCDMLVQEALRAAEEIEGVKTEFITLAEKKIAACEHCQYCVNNQTYCRIQDDAQAVWGKD
jgi:multimeric flavodoxin WrbA